MVNDPSPLIFPGTGELALALLFPLPCSLGFRALCILRTHWSTELHPQPQACWSSLYWGNSKALFSLFVWYIVRIMSRVEILRAQLTVFLSQLPELPTTISGVESIFFQEISTQIFSIVSQRYIWLFLYRTKKAKVKEPPFYSIVFCSGYHFF